MSLNPALAAHYRQLLGLPTPWKILDVNMQIPDQRIDITISWPDGRSVPCPECSKRCGMKDHREERVWRHLDTMQFKTFLRCRVPRCECPVHGAKTIATPWSAPGSRWTLLFEAFALEVMLHVSSISKATTLLGLSWDEAHALRKRAVDRGLARRDLEGIEYLGLDEKSFGRKERFITILADLSGERVLEVAPSKSTEAACTVLRVLPESARETVQGIAMDMAAAYEKACNTVFPGAEIVYDRFHVENTLSTAMDTVRRMEQKKLLMEGVTILTKKRYIFLRRPERWSEKQRQQFRDIKREFGAVRFSQSRIGRAWVLKESFRTFWNYATVTWGKKFFDRWYFWATHSRIDPMIRAARTLKNHLDGLLAYFRHGITNAFTEGTNSRIQEIKAAARGFRNFENYRIAILFYCGKLDMKPQ
jgi:transposase